MYEMKGALSGHAAPDHPVTRAPVPDRQSPSYPVPVQPVTQPPRSRLRRSPSFPGPDSASHPAAPAPVPPVAQLPRFQFGRSPSRSGCGRLVAQPLAFSRPVTRPPGAVRPPPVPGTRWKARFPGLSRAPGDPRMVPVSNGECIFTPPAPVAQEPAGIHFRLFLCPHIIHRIAPVIRTSPRLSTALCTAIPQVTRRNPRNAALGAPASSPSPHPPGTSRLLRTFPAPQLCTGEAAAKPGPGSRAGLGASPVTVFTASLIMDSYLRFPGGKCPR